jgi:ribosomal protein S18 acetylase RimI-like enzyme
MATDAEMENEDAQQFWSDLGFEETWRIVQYRKSLGVPEPAPKPAGRRAAKKKKNVRKRTRSRR